MANSKFSIVEISFLLLLLIGQVRVAGMPCLICFGMDPVIGELKRGWDPNKDVCVLVSDNWKLV